MRLHPLGTVLDTATLCVIVRGAAHKSDGLLGSLHRKCQLHFRGPARM